MPSRYSELDLAETLTRPGYRLSRENRASKPITRIKGNKHATEPQNGGNEPRSIRLTLPYAPSANRYWRNVNGRMVKSAEARNYQDEVGYRFLQQAGLGTRPFEGDIAITLSVFRPQKRGDLDNRLKVVIDSLQGLAFNDDAQISIIHAARFDDKNNPRIEVHVSEVAP